MTFENLLTVPCSRIPDAHCPVVRAGNDPTVRVDRDSCDIISRILSQSDNCISDAHYAVVRARNNPAIWNDGEHGNGKLATLLKLYRFQVLSS